MEVDISKKVNYLVKFGLAGIVAAAVLCSAGIWLWHQQNAYMTISNAKVASALVGAKVQAPGTMEAILVNEGDRVEAGQVLAKMKVKVTEEQIQQLEQSLELAKKNYTEVMAGTVESQPVEGSSSGNAASAQADLERAAGAKARMDQLYAIGAISAVQHDRAEAAYQAAQAAVSAAQNSAAAYQSYSAPSSPAVIKAAQMQVSQAQMALDTAKKNMGATAITAPVAGTVYYTEVQTGSEVEAGQVVLNIGDAGNLWLELYLTEEQRGKVRLGQFVSYTIGETDCQGTVLEIKDPAAPAAGDEAEPAGVTVRISLPLNVAGEVKPGMTAVAKIALN